MLAVITKVQILLSGRRGGKKGPLLHPCLQNEGSWRSERDVMVQIDEGRQDWEGCFLNLKCDLCLSLAFLDLWIRDCIPTSPLMPGCETLVGVNLLCWSLHLHGNLHTSGTQRMWQMEQVKEGIRRKRSKVKKAKGEIINVWNSQPI